MNLLCFSVLPRIIVISSLEANYLSIMKRFCKEDGKH